jgi:23S rRNA (adenine2503-C2)-methyltransferase
MGEPLHNYEGVMTALEIITDTRGLNIGPGRITVSTVGVVPGILRLAEEGRPYNLAVSLHGASEAERTALVPITRRWPLSEVIDACRTYCRMTGRKIFFQWTLIAGVNDSPAHAERLGALLQGVDAHVNLIPLNPTQGFEAGPSGSPAALEFQRILKLAEIPNTVPIAKTARFFLARMARCAYQRRPMWCNKVHANGGSFPCVLVRRAQITEWADVR